MLDRRNFLNAGVTAGAGVVPLASALNHLEAMPLSSIGVAARKSTNPAEFQLLGPQKISLKLPSRAKVKSVELLRSGQRLPFSFENQNLHFAIPALEDYEVATIPLG
jgi:hypothetical protein